ncbi:MAG: hypothetical protein C0623_11650 [Desulfuromonas sp.]|nr:MAG: hypothetical protein C0623_11650 [Desulfuromonas sp.]
MAEFSSLQQNGQRALENSVIRLLKEKPFYGHFLMNFRRELTSTDGCLGATVRNGTPLLAINPEPFLQFSNSEQQALLEHGLKHILHMHPFRRGIFHPLTWDVATDLAINPTIDNLPAEALQPDRFRLEPGRAAEEYARLLTPQFDTGNLRGDGYGTATPEKESADGPERESTSAQSFAPRTIDDHSLWDDAGSTPERLAEQAVRDMVVDAHRKSGGEVPADVQQLVEGWLVPPAIPWREILRQFVATAGRVGIQSTWKRQHRRFSHSTPGVRKKKRLNLLVGIDTSESTDILELRKAFARELLQIARSRDSLITVLYANSRIQKVDSFTGSNVVAEVVTGGGFTDLRPVFAYARTMQPQPAAVIYLTDGYGPVPETMEFPTLWALTIDGQKPADWGVELRLHT